MEEKQPPPQICKEFRDEADNMPVPDNRLRDLEQMRRLQAQMALRK